MAAYGPPISGDITGSVRACRQSGRCAVHRGESISPSAAAPSDWRGATAADDLRLNVEAFVVAAAVVLACKLIYGEARLTRYVARRLLENYWNARLEVESDGCNFIQNCVLFVYHTP